MQKRTKCFLILWCIIMVGGEHNAAAQSKPDVVETPFTLLLDIELSSETFSEKPSKLANLQKRNSLRTVAGRRLKVGIRASEYLDGRGGRITLAGLSNESDVNADQIIYQIPARSKHARSLVTVMESRYGQADEIKNGERVWHIRNPDMRHGQAKVITMRMRETAGKLTIIADRTPIIRRGELLVKPQRQLPSGNQASSRNTQQSVAQSLQKQSQEQYSID